MTANNQPLETAAAVLAHAGIKLPNVAQDNRRRCTLRKVALKNLEPIESTPEPTEGATEKI